MRVYPIAALALALTAGAEAQTFSPDRIRADVAFLADDLLEGRGTGTRGYDLAAKYVAARFEALGLKPAGNDGSWYQNISFVSVVPDPARRSALTINNHRYLNGEEVLVGPSTASSAIDGSAPAIFVGYGLEDPQFGFDDYRGLDVRGKIVVALFGTPPGLPSDIAGTLTEKKLDLIQSKGAVGVIQLTSAERLKNFSWAKAVEYQSVPRMRWVHPDGHVEEGVSSLKLSATIHPSFAGELFKATPLEGKLQGLFDKPALRPRGFDLPSSLRVERYGVATRLNSANVLGLLEGSDPALANEVVMVTAHLDHLGVFASGQDRIANGAMDNASGVATMLEAARAFAESGARPKRSILFVALTGEEKGDYGSQYLARYPLPTGRKLVANVNLDMPILTYDFVDVVAIGAEHSTVGEAASRAAFKAGIRLSPDQQPEEQWFIRSDQYSFVQAGIPSIYLVTGLANGGEAAGKTFNLERYHEPSDDLSAPFNWNAAAKFAKVNYLIARELADAPERPRWYKGDYFGDKFAPTEPKVAAPKGGAPVSAN